MVKNLKNLHFFRFFHSWDFFPTIKYANLVSRRWYANPDQYSLKFMSLGNRTNVGGGGGRGLAQLYDLPHLFYICSTILYKQRKDTYSLLSHHAFLLGSHVFINPSTVGLLRYASITRFSLPSSWTQMFILLLFLFLLCVL